MHFELRYTLSLQPKVTLDISNHEFYIESNNLTLKENLSVWQRLNYFFQLLNKIITLLNPG